MWLFSLIAPLLFPGCGQEDSGEASITNNQLDSSDSSCSNVGVDTALGCCPAADPHCSKTSPQDFREEEGRAFLLQDHESGKNYRYIRTSELSEYYCDDVDSRRPHLFKKLGCAAPKTRVLRTYVAPRKNEECFNAKQAKGCLDFYTTSENETPFDIKQEGYACRLPHASPRKFQFTVWEDEIQKMYSCSHVKRPIYVSLADPMIPKDYGPKW